MKNYDVKSEKAPCEEQIITGQQVLNEDGYHRTMSNRHVQMIAIGGAIGTGLFLGAGARLQIAGPSLAIVYIICGVFSYLILRALGELIMHRPTSGSFVSYSREFLGEKTSYVAGWMYFFSWAMTGIVDITAVALYMQHWAALSDIPQWVFSLVALFLVASMNFIGVKYFAEMEFWFALIKVLAILAFLIVGALILGTGHKVGVHDTGLHLIRDNGGIFPHGILPAIVLIQGVVFAFASIELVGVTAGECKDPRKVLPKAINSVIWRVAIFYVGSVILLVCLLPWNVYSKTESPFVTFFENLGIPGVGDVMNVVVITAALSSLNSGLYSTGRILRSLSIGGSAPSALSKMSKQSVPYVGILVTVAVYFFGVFLNYLIPTQVFEVVMNLASLGIISTWGTIVLCQMKFRSEVKKGNLPGVSFRMPFAPFSSWLTLGFLAFVLFMTSLDYPNGTYSIALIPILALVLWVGWGMTRKRKKLQNTTTVISE